MGISKIKILATIWLLIISGTFSCQKHSNSCQYYSPPNSLFFQIKKNGVILSNNILNNLKLYYTKNNTKVYITDLVQAVDSYANQGILTTREIGTLGTQNYILEYNNGFGNDTIYVDYSDETPATNCQYILRQIKFNNALVSSDSSFGYQPVYVFNK